MRELRPVGWATTFVLLLTVSQSNALDHFLTFGGGYSPSGNQVSLEKNALMFQQFLAERYPQGVPHDVFFADGDAPARDLQFADPTYQIPRPNLLLARLAREENDLGYQYRNHQVPGVAGPSSRAAIERWFQEVGSKLPSGDRLFIYFTGHGGKTDDASNTIIHLWNQEKINVREFVGLLDKVPTEVPVVMVMVQCYSGGFANTIFNEGQSAKGATPRNRCGFFSTVQDRTAAGCTPDIEEENYKEYSSYFWSAIRGKTRIGQSVELPDFDLNGRISFAEAHAYSLVTSDTIDISTKTSDALLRATSRNTGSEPGLLTADASYQQLIASATPTDRVVLDKLSQQFGLSGQNRGQEARQLAERLQQEMDSLNEERKKKSGPYDGVRRDILAECKVRWPELANRWDPKVFELLIREGDGLVSIIERHPRYSEFSNLHDEIELLAERKLDVERKWVRCQRLLRVIDNIALAANLRLVASPEAQARYQQLLELESSAL